MIDEWMMNVDDFHACLISVNWEMRHNVEVLNEGSVQLLSGWSMKVVTVDNLPARSASANLS